MSPLCTLDGCQAAHLPKSMQRDLMWVASARWVGHAFRARVRNVLRAWRAVKVLYLRKQFTHSMILDQFWPEYGPDPLQSSVDCLGRSFGEGWGFSGGWMTILSGTGQHPISKGCLQTCDCQKIDWLVRKVQARWINPDHKQSTPCPNMSCVSYSGTLRCVQRITSEW